MFLTYQCAVECADHPCSYHSAPQMKSCDCRTKENARITETCTIKILHKKSSGGSYIIYWTPTSIPTHLELGPNLTKCTKANEV